MRVQLLRRLHRYRLFAINARLALSHMEPQSDGPRVGHGSGSFVGRVGLGPVWGITKLSIL